MNGINELIKERNELIREVRRLQVDCQDLALVISEIAEIVGLRDSEPELCRKTKKLVRNLITTVRGIQEMAEEDIRLGNADGTFIWQIEANAKAVLSGNGRRTILTPENERGDIIDN